MNSLNHFVFSFTLCILYLGLSEEGIFYSALFSLIFSVLIDLDHLYKRKERPWYRRRTWIQEPLGLVFIAFPVAFFLSLLDRRFLLLTLISYSAHIFLDYICVKEAFPLAPFSRIKRSERLRIFDSIFQKSGKISEIYFLILNLILLTFLFLKASL